MRKSTRLLTALLLVIIGIGIGILLMLFRLELIPAHVPTQMQVTEVKRNSEPVELTGFHVDSGSSVREIAELVVPTVVYIETSVPSSERSMPDDENHDLDENFWDRFLPRGRSSSIGSGVIISSDGFIMTNNHVISGGRNLRVTLSDKREYDAYVVGADPSTDLAIIKINGENLPQITIGNSDHLQIGDWVMAVGNPLRLRSTVTAGIVSALSRDVQIINDRLRIESFIQTDAAINRGNSGGALVNSAGELIGINTAIATENGAYQGYGFAIPINMAFKISADLMEFGEVKRAFLGVQIVSINQERAQELNMPMIQGVEIIDLVDNGAAFNAGLKKNDVVLKVNDTPVNESNELQAQIALFRPGESVMMKIWRDGAYQDISVSLSGLENQAIEKWASQNPWDNLPELEDEELPDDTEMDPVHTFEQGFTIAEYAKSDEPGTFDLIVVKVLENSPAEEAGLKIDDIILSVNDVLVQDAESLKAGFENAPMGYQNTIEVLRGEELIQIRF